jgi:periplasmic protein TonB
VGIRVDSPGALFSFRQCSRCKRSGYHVTRERLVDITYDNRPEQLDTPEAAADIPIPKRRTLGEDRSMVLEREHLLSVCAIVSLILHVCAIAVLPRLSALQQVGPPFNPDDNKIIVRPVDLSNPPYKEEPPPDDASAISDRNHTAEKERIPKTIPTPKTGPIVKNEIPQQIASPNPSPAAEQAETRRPKKQRTTNKRLPKKEKSAGKSKTKSPPRPALATKEDMEKWDVALQPTTEDIQRAFATARSGGSPDVFPDGDADEIVVDMNTREDRFASYLLGVQEKIERSWTYPTSAGRSGIGGTLMLEFVVVKDGSLEGPTLLHSSGHAILDQAALCAIRTAAPFHEFPKGVRAKRLRIRSSFTYATSGDFVRDASDFVRRVLR